MATLAAWALLAGDNPLFHVFSGSLLLCALFMATDPFSSPRADLGRWLFGGAIGLGIMAMRFYSPLPEGTSFAILGLNTTVPLVNKYTAKKKKPQATFSACFGSPFMPLHHNVYATLLGQKIAESGARVFLVNTGWIGGGYGQGRRISIAHTRAIITAILNGDLDQCTYREDTVFKLLVPEMVPGLPPVFFTPREAWADHAQYDATALHLAERFRSNFRQFGATVSEIAAAGPLGDRP